MRILFLLALPILIAAEPCRITVVDAENGWPVPMVELTTTSHLKFITDNAGVVAFDAPEFMNRETWLGVQSHGYSVKADGFGYRGVRVTPTAGGSITIIVNRDIVAKRVGRITGSGLFAESQKLGDFPEWKENGITGCDTVQMASIGGKRFWLWGDTNLPNYPLGIYHVLAATSEATPFDSLKPPLKPKFDYFRDVKQKPVGVAKIPGDGPTWLFGLVTLKDGERERLVSSYVKTKEYLKEYERGLCEWNEKESRFIHLKTIWTDKDAKTIRMPGGHAVPWTDEMNKKWILFCDPFPFLKCPADYASWQDPKTWQTVEPPKLAIAPHGGSIGWHEWRKKWVGVFVQKNGKPSTIGEVWYTESDSPFGPWSEPVRVLTHNNYTFYNPMVHTELVAKDSPVLLFEGTYTAEFANRAVPTPRYNYNQMLYRLDLDQPPFSKLAK